MTKGLLTTFPTFSSQYLNIVSMSNTSTKILIETSKGLLSLKQISEISGIELPIIRNRYYRGKRGDELFAPKTNAPVMLEYNGKPLPISEVSEITGLDIYCQGTQGEMYSWDVSGLRLYRVDQIIDVVTSERNNLIRFNGSQLAYLEERNGNGGEVFSWTGNTLFQLRQHCAELVPVGRNPAGFPEAYQGLADAKFRS